MVNAAGQLFTIEGVAAGLIMLLTAYIIVGTTSLYTPGDTHISDMQLEQLGNDALHMMNTPNTSAESVETPLASIIRTNDTEQFRQQFLWFCNSTTGGTYDNIQFSTDIYYRNNATNSVNHYHFSESRIPSGGEQTMRVTEWVLVQNIGPPLDHMPIGVDTRPQEVLVEVLLWRN